MEVPGGNTARKKSNRPTITAKSATAAERTGQKKLTEKLTSEGKEDFARCPKNVISGEGNIAVDMTFESLDDFSPAKVAEKVEGLKELLKARQELANLLSYMDGKSGAEDLLNKILEDPALLKALSAKAKEVTEKKEKGE